jgi:hypothetical protein
MPLFQYEISVRWNDRGLSEFLGVTPDESTWVRISNDPASEIRADVYGSLFSAPISQNVSISPVPAAQTSVLNAAFDMDHWPDAADEDIEEALRSNRHASYLAAFDIGQGSASAILDDQAIPWLYHDLGAGVYRNSGTTPTPLKFCFTHSPPIVLSHWDSDHWAGAGYDPDALVMTWVAPRQSIGPTHTAFAASILSAGGSLLIWPARQAPISIGTSPGQLLNVGRATGSNRNGSCLVLRMDDHETGAVLHWLLTGDAGYHQLPFGLPGKIAAMTVPHHGAKMAGAGSLPVRMAAGYARLLYSFGPGNLHGGTNVQHPVKKSVDDHDARGWHPGTWRGLPHPGTTIANGDILATAEHPNMHRGGLIAGWTSPPVPGSRPCGRKCTTRIAQA